MPELRIKKKVNYATNKRAFRINVKNKKKLLMEAVVVVANVANVVNIADLNKFMEAMHISDKNDKNNKNESMNIELNLEEFFLG